MRDCKFRLVTELFSCGRRVGCIRLEQSAEPTWRDLEQGGYIGLCEAKFEDAVRKGHARAPDPWFEAAH